MARYKLDTGNSGSDEILVGDSVAEVTQDVLNRYEVDELPEGWTIDLIDDPAIDYSTLADKVLGYRFAFDGWLEDTDGYRCE